MAEPLTEGARSNHRGLMIVLSYLWPLALVPFLLEKHDREVQWHARHGIVLMLAELVLWAGLAFMTNIAALAALGLVVLLGLLTIAAYVIVLTLHIVAIAKGLTGGRLIVPGLSEFADSIFPTPPR